jgi:transcriptional regulator with XRE-family HTH domain
MPTNQSQDEAATTLRKKILGVLLRHARLRANLSLKDVSGISGLSSGAISDYEYGRRELSLAQLEVLADIYRVPVAYFWSDSPLVRDEERILPVEEILALRNRIVGTLLRQARMEAGHSQSDLAEFLDCPPSRISNYEFGRAEIPLTELESIAGFLGVPMSYFLDQGIRPQGQQMADIDEMKQICSLPEDVRRFVLHPGNELYLRVAMQLSALPAPTLRRIGEGLLEVTY